VLGVATITGSSVTANGHFGVAAWKEDEECKATVTIGDTVECSSNNPSGVGPPFTDYDAVNSGTFPGLSAEKITHHTTA